MRFQFVLLLCIVVLSGCGTSEPELQPVTGRVTFKDKKAIQGAIVEFVSEGGPGVRGKTDSDGRFELTTNGHKGAMTGKYQVAILQMLVIDGAASHSKAHHATLVIHPKYAKLETSGLEREVKAGSNEFTFELDTAAQR